MSTVGELIGFLNELAPLGLAESWDNVGLIVGDERGPARSVLTCLTVTPEVVAEAVRDRADLIVSHHPMLFRPVQRLTAGTSEGRMLLDLAAAGISVYSAHTAYDSAADGINQQLAQSLDLRNIAPLRSITEGASHHEVQPGEQLPGAGRFGDLPDAVSLKEFLEGVKKLFGLAQVQYTGDLDKRVKWVGIACGSAAEFMRDAAVRGCEVLVTGEARFHACLEARALGIALVLLGHYASERPAVERLAEVLQARFPQLTVRASRAETDPVQWL